MAEEEQSSLRTRSGSISRDILDISYKEQSEYICKQKLQTGEHLIGRMIYLCSAKPEKKSLSQNEAGSIVAKELYDDWVSKNVYPILEKNIAGKIKADYNTFLNLHKQFHSVKRKKTDSWHEKAQQFNSKMTKIAYDVRTQDKAYQKKLEEHFGVKMTAEDEEFYRDNCHGSYKAICQTTVSRKWAKQTKRLAERSESAKKKCDEAKESRQNEQIVRQLQYAEAVEPESEYQSSAVDVDFTPSSSSTSHKKDVECSKRVTRSTVAETVTTSEEREIQFPQMPVRKSRKCIDERIIRCNVQCLAEFNVSRDDVAGIMIKTANIIFGQNWIRKTRLEDDEDDWSEEETDDTDSEHHNAKRRRSAKDLTNVFPSNRCIDKYLEDAAYMNLKMAAEYLINKDETDVITVGLDDTTKAAGHKSFDVKTDHITISGPSKPKKALTTGYLENVSHSGSDGASAYEFKLKCLSVLADCSVEELKGSIDFWITDRAGDCATMLQNLGVEDEKILKCCAHLILGIDHACDKVFKETEQKIGVQKLLELSAGQQAFLSPSTSIHTLGQIAIAKLLSPSHANHSVSLFNEYKEWMEMHNISHDGFKGFCANRFGRIAEIAKEFTARRQSIIDFFDAVVDINSNRLVLAVSTYIQNDWFVLCSRVYAEIGELLIFPLMQLLGIDHQQSRTEMKDGAGWTGVREFFKVKMSEVETLKEQTDTSTGEGRLFIALLNEIIDTLKRQLGEMKFFTTDDETCPVNPKMDYAPLTNLGSESEFAKFDNRLKVSGGTTSVTTISRKNVVATNAYLVDSSFLQMSAHEKDDQWKWARTSDEVKQVTKMEKDFFATVRQAKRLALQKKEQLKKKKSNKTMEILEKCKLHGGPITPGSLELLSNLDEKKLLTEIAYLRITIAPNIRQRRRITLKNGKHKMEKFTTEELRTSIKNAVSPENEIINDVNELLKSVL
jgi:hypothetical protein